METVENKYITVAYKLYSIENGEKDFEEEAPVEHPFQFISGLGMTLEPFEAQIKDLQIGDKFDFTIPASEAYGEYDDDHVIDLPKEIFMIEGEFDSDRVVEGAVIPLMTSEGQLYQNLMAGKSHKTDPALCNLPFTKLSYTFCS